MIWRTSRGQAAASGAWPSESRNPAMLVKPYERVCAEGQPVTWTRCSGVVSFNSQRDSFGSSMAAAGADCTAVEAECERLEKEALSGPKRTRRGGRGRKGKPKSEVSPARSVSSVCADMVCELLEEPRSEVSKLAVVLDEKRRGYSYLKLFRPAYVEEQAQRLGPCPTLRALLKCGPGKFLPVVDLNNRYLCLYDSCAWVVEKPNYDVASVRFWAMVRSVPEGELSMDWRMAIGDGIWQRCAVPGVAAQGFRVA